MSLNKTLNLLPFRLGQSASTVEGGAAAVTRKESCCSACEQRERFHPARHANAPCPSTFQEGAVGSVGVSGLVRPADSDSTGESGTRGAGRHLLQHAHAAADAQHRGHASPAQKGEKHEMTEHYDPLFLYHHVAFVPNKSRKLQLHFRINTRIDKSSG